MTYPHKTILALKSRLSLLGSLLERLLDRDDEVQASAIRAEMSMIRDEIEALNEMHEAKR